MPHTIRTLTLLGLCLTLARPAATAADETAADPAPDPAAGMKVSGPMQAHAQLQQRFRNERAAAAAAALEGLRSNREDDLRVDPLTQLAVVALARRDEVKRIAEESALPDDRKLGQKLAAFYDAEQRRASALAASTENYTRYRDRFLEWEEELAVMAKTIDRRQKQYERYLEDVERVANLDQFTGLEQTVRRVLRQRAHWGAALDSVKKALRDMDLYRGKAQMLDEGGRSEARQVKERVKALDPDRWRYTVKQLPDVVPKDGAGDFAVYADADDAWREALNEHLDRIAGPYDEFKDGVAQELIDFCQAAPATIRRYERQRKQLETWKEELEELRDELRAEARELEERQNRGVTGRADD